MERQNYGLLFCTDCTLVVVNGDSSGISDEKRLEEVNKGLDNLEPNVVYIGEHSEFSWSQCDCCKSTLGGSRHEFDILK